MTTERVRLLRAQMNTAKLSAYIIPTDDAHQVLRT